MSLQTRASSWGRAVTLSGSGTSGQGRTHLKLTSDIHTSDFSFLFSNGLLVVQKYHLEIWILNSRDLLIIDMTKRRRNTQEKWSRRPRRSETAPVKKLTDPRLAERRSADGLGSYVTGSCVIPTWTPWLVSLMTLVFRVYHVTEPRNWWVLHPDEVFQSMEVAHSELYGYGLRPYEFNQLPKGDNLSQYQARELNLGMYALRSPLQAQFLVLVVWLLHSLGLHVHEPYLIFRLSHVMISSALPLAVSRFTLAVSRQPDAASLAAILVGISAYLNVMGTHTLVNSFVSPAIFLGLARAVDVVHSVSTESNDLTHFGNGYRGPSDDLLYCHDSVKHIGSTDSYNQQGKDSRPRWNEKDAFSQNRNNQEKRRQTEGTNLRYANDDESNENNGNEAKPCLTYTGLKDGKVLALDHMTCLTDVNMEDVFYGKRAPVLQASPSDSGYASMTSRNSSGSDSRKSSTSDSKHICSTIGAKSYSNRCCTTDCTENHTDAESEAATKHETLARFCEMTSAKGREDKTHTVISHLADLTSGCMLALAVYIRPDAALFLSAILLARCRQIPVLALLTSSRTWWMVLGISTGFALGGTDDIFFYDDFVLSPVNWFYFNVWNSVASRLFGISKTSFYIHRVFLNGFGMIVVSFVYALALMYVCFSFITQYTCKECECDEIKREKGKPQNLPDTKFDFMNKPPSCFISKQKRETISLRQNVGCTILLTAIYSCFGHKEERFLHDILVLYLVTVSDFIISIVESIPNFRVIQKAATFFDLSLERSKNKCQGTAVALFISVFLMLEVHTFQTSTRAATKQWVFSSTASGEETNLCLHFLSKQHDVTGVYIERNFQDTGGYTILHKNVPLIYLLGQVFFEFTNSSMYKNMAPCVIDERQGRNSTREECSKGFYSITTVSDLVHKDNTQDLLRKIAGLPTFPNNDGQNVPASRDRILPELGKHRPQRYPQQPRYNYAIIRAGKKFLSPAFTPVYRTPSIWLWRRGGEPNAEAWLQEMAGHSSRKQNHHVTSASSGFGKLELGTTEGVGHVNKIHVNGSSSLPQFAEIPKSSNERKSDENTNPSGRGNTGTEANKMKEPRPNCENNDTCARVKNLSSAAKNIKPKPGENIPDSLNKDAPKRAKILEYEGELLKQMGNYWQAYQRFETLTSEVKGYRNKEKVKIKASVLASASFCLHRLGKTREMQRLLKECLKLYPRDQCLDGARSRVLDLADNM
ncbi:hypothetical protein RRG08_007689 [Elysia crispata]|uniref:Mannosyltransferase n=1 Tax=Elysia crispata TaxID=231223 RepID=A0AAE0YU15_9GAST|nr:hypothetical protein RRG08_007689 [Elysia crispata]